MVKRKTVLVVAGVLIAAGAAVAVSAPGERGRGWGPMTFGGWGEGGMRGWGRHWRGPVTEEEFDARARERFARLDKNGDGVIDASELEAAFKQRMSERGRFGERLGRRLMRHFDTDRDDRVTKDEFMDTVRKRFARFDLDNNGRIDEADLPPVMRGRGLLIEEGAGGRRMGPVLRLLRDADADKDGVVTLEEALALAEKRFAALDRNKDGTIDGGDGDALRSEMLDYRVKRFIHAFDGGAEGKVTRDQFLARAKERFARMDLDRDGTLSRDEMPGRHMGRGWRRHGHGHGHGGPDWDDDDATAPRRGGSERR
jgi:Ca2+-binding EF-hand superfamily protein